MLDIQNIYFQTCLHYFYWCWCRPLGPNSTSTLALSLLLLGMVNMLNLVSGIKQKIIIIMLIYQSYKYHTSALRIIFTEYPILSSYYTHRSELLLSFISCVNIQPSKASMLSDNSSPCYIQVAERGPPLH